MRLPFARSAPLPDDPPVAPTYIALDPRAMDSVFVAPRWLRDAGMTSWLALGAALLLTAVIALLALTATIVVPLIVAAVIAAVASPVVGWQQRKGIPRGVGTLVFVLLLLVFAGFFAWAVMSGIVSQSAKSGDELRHASNQITSWLSDHGIDTGSAASAQKSVETGATKSVSTLLSGVVGFVGGLSSIVFGLAMVMISLIFMLKDGPMIRAWTERHMAVPDEVAHIITGRVIGSLRGYFFGVTIIAIFNAIVVALGAIVLGVPLVATIALVTFIGAYIPFLGAWVAGAFSVLIAFGADSQTAIVGMIIVQILANGLLQQLVQPIAYGAALGIHPLAALVATIGGGCLFGSIGLILGAPIVSAVVRISADLANARVDADGEAPEAPPGEAAPATA